MFKLKNPIIWVLFALIALLIPKPKGKKKIIEWSKAYDILQDGLGKECTLYLVDGKYRVPTLESMRKFLEEDKTNLSKYVSEWHDCDDFAFRLMGQFSIPGWSDIAFGIAISSTHMYNCFIGTDDGKMVVYIVEPQSDRIFVAKEVKGKEYRTVFTMM